MHDSEYARRPPLDRFVPSTGRPSPLGMSANSAAKQKAFFLESKFGNFAVRTTDVAQPGPGQLLIKVEAAALNPIDWKLQAYNALDLVEVYPCIPGWDLSGTVAAVGEGEGARVFAIGDRV